MKTINEKSPAKVDELDEDVMREMAYTCRGDLCPFAAIMGGVAAQEVMKVRGQGSNVLTLMNVLNAITYFENIPVWLIGHLYKHVHASEILRLVK